MYVKIEAWEVGAWARGRQRGECGVAAVNLGEGQGFGVLGLVARCRRVFLVNGGGRLDATSSAALCSVFLHTTIWDQAVADVSILTLITVHHDCVQV
jgi:hypothetical protein